MKLKELKEILKSLDENLDVTICDYENDDNEQFIFRDISGVEIADTDSGIKVISIYVNLKP